MTDQPKNHQPQHLRLQKIIESEKTDLALAMVYPCDRVSLQSALEIHENRLAKVILVGPKGTIEKAAQANNLDISCLEIMDTPEEAKEAAKAATLGARAGKFAVLMKGSLHTDELMAAVVNKESGLRTQSRISHVMVCDVPSYHKLIALTDCVVNIAPNLDQKKYILTDAIQFLHSIGIARPKVGIVAAVETVNPAMPATLDAAELVTYARTPGFPQSDVEGPFGFDNAISKESAKIKGIESNVSGDPDLLLLPDLQSANILYKSLIYMAQGACAGTVIGAKVPIVLTSRADSVFSRLASVAVSIRSARHQKS